MKVVKEGVIAALLVLTIGWVSHPGVADAASQDDKQQAADAQVARIGDPARYLQDQRAKVADARAGKYGKLSPLDIRRIDAAEQDIVQIVSGRESLDELDARERITVYNAQETIASIASGDRNSRMVCKQVQRAGTRLKTMQCMSAEEDEMRTEGAREAARNAQRIMCVAGQEC